MTYIDPGSGSYLFQLLAGTALGVGAVIALGFRRTIGRLLRRRSSGSAEATPQSAPEHSEPTTPPDTEG